MLLKVYDILCLFYVWESCSFSFYEIVLSVNKKVSCEQRRQVFFI